MRLFMISPMLSSSSLIRSNISIASAKARLIYSKVVEGKMPLFTCSKCKCVENTALSRFWHQPDHEKLCSLCDPKVGKWHGKFPRARDDQSTGAPIGKIDNQDVN